MKRLVALMLAVAVCLSVVGVAMAEDGNPGECHHAYDELGTTIMYKRTNDTQHCQICTTQYKCSKCGHVMSEKKEELQPHASKDNKTYNYHLDGYHYFYQLCACGIRLNQTSAPCPGGDNHIGIILGLPPVVLEAK